MDYIWHLLDREQLPKSGILQNINMDIQSNTEGMITSKLLSLTVSSQSLCAF